MKFRRRVIASPSVVALTAIAAMAHAGLLVEFQQSRLPSRQLSSNRAS
ncbi:hypothetical protein [Halomicronema sp. CCY15110]|nr:hypothetical protein [Halomicronema sp. CCY15110]